MKHVKHLLILTAVLNSPAILFWIPGLGMLFILPFFFWINIPALWFGLAKLIGKPHYEISAFGASPQTPLAWLLIVGFWTLLAFGLTVMAAYVPELKWRFSLRTLLIATTVVALVLGVVCYTVR